MNHTNSLPQEIRATIHQGAINRVPSFFNATTKDILMELMQNARRSGATRVSISRNSEETVVYDNGMGIADPAAILAFGQSDWEDPTTRNEHPAGMGFYAVARRDSVQVRSKTPNGAAWAVHLTADHFTGKLSAPVEPLPQWQESQGTTVIFAHNPEELALSNNSLSTYFQVVQELTRHYPLPVSYNGQEMTRVDFLQNALYTEEWEGLRIGVYSNNNQKAMNFHGLVIKQTPIPSVSAIKSQWTASVDVVDCPHLELTLPARKELVQTAFSNELTRACRRTIYQAMLQQDEAVDVPKEVQDDARSMGINLPDARPTLEQWTADKYKQFNYRFQNNPRVPVSKESIIMGKNLEHSIDQQTVVRAAELNHISDRLMVKDQRMEGYTWYDKLTRITEIKTTVTINGKDQDLDTNREREEEFETQRPDRIVLNLKTVNENGQVGDLDLPTDLAFANPEQEDPSDNNPLVTRDSQIDVNELVDIMVDGYFMPDEDGEQDSYDTQEEQHRAEYEKTAFLLLSSEDDALTNTITNLIRRYILYEAPPNRAVTIHIDRANPGNNLQVTLGDRRTGPTSPTETRMNEMGTSPPADNPIN